MVTAKIRIGSIDYEKSFKELFPVFIRKLEIKEQKEFALRFLGKMGEESMTAVLGILALLDDDSKMEILCSIIDSYSGDISIKINEALEKDETGRNIHIHKISASCGADGLTLYAGEVGINYGGLLDNPSIQKKIGEMAGTMVQGLGGTLRKLAEREAGVIAKTVATLAPGEVEKLGLNVLQKPENKERLLSLAEKVLNDKGIWLRLIDIELNQAGRPAAGTVLIEGVECEEKRGRFISEVAEEKLMDAVVEYLKMLIAQ